MKNADDPLSQCALVRISFLVKKYSDIEKSVCAGLVKYAAIFGKGFSQFHQ